MAESLQDLFRMKLAKMREDSSEHGMTFPFLHDLSSPSPEEAMPSASSGGRERPSTSRPRKELAPEVQEMRRQFKVIQVQLGAATQAQKSRAEKKERKRQERREEAKRKEAESKTKSKAKTKAKELSSTSTKASGTSTSSSSRASERRQDPWHKQTLVPQQHKTTAADLASRDRIKFMTYKDKCLLTRDLGQLPEKQLGGMVRILRSREPKLKKVRNNKMEVNLDSLKPATLWELKEYVAACRQKKAFGVAAGTSQGKRAGSSSSRPGSESQAQTQSESETEWETPSSSDSDS
uniref:NET domain-containing protein n=1 Tax=Pipistrellus kuhlii TaxID=59472 RepID=A0A7J7T1Q5_PIPKU|nr:hypothetical protein mPipKuh1_009712 [Pipistrellus kuhlii]